MESGGGNQTQVLIWDVSILALVLTAGQTPVPSVVFKRKKLVSIAHLSGRDSQHRKAVRRDSENPYAVTCGSSVNHTPYRASLRNIYI